MEGIGRLLLRAGIVLLAVGLVLTLAPRIPGLSALGRLPGDLRIERPGFRLYLPITTSILASVVLTLLARLFFRR